MTNLKIQREFLIRFAAQPSSPPIDDITADGTPPTYREIIRRAQSDADLMCGIQLASFQTWKKTMSQHPNEASLSPKEERRLALTLLRYDNRRRTRATPFGNFAFTALGSFEPCRAKQLPTMATGLRVQPDLDWFCTILRNSSDKISLLLDTQVQTHHLVYSRGGRIWLDNPVNSAKERNDRSRIEVSSMADTPAVKVILDFADHPVTIQEVVRHVTRISPNAPVDAILRGVSVLIDHGFLLTELAPQLGSRTPWTNLQDWTARQHVDAPEQISRLLALLTDDESFGHCKPSQTSRVQNLDLQCRRIYNAPSTIHVDAYSSEEATLDQSVLDQCQLLAETLYSLGEPYLGSRYMQSYRDQFLEKYGISQLVRITELIDPSHGLGEPDSWTDDSKIPNASVLNSVTRDIYSQYQQMLNSQTSSREVVLTRNTVLERGSAETVPPLPGTDINVDIVTGEGDAFVLCTTPNPGSCEANSTRARFEFSFPDEKLMSLTPASSCGGTEVVEIVFAPSAQRCLNLMNAPRSTTRYIPIGLPDSGPGAISLTDLWVGADANGLYVYDASAQCRVRPIVRSMVNVETQAPPIVRLLWELGQGTGGFWAPWRWGTLRELAFLPRVRIENCVLTPAQWSPAALRKRLREESNVPRDEILLNWAQEVQLPNSVQVMSSDQRLTLDIQRPYHRWMLLEEMERDTNAVIQESPEQIFRDVWGVRSDTSGELVFTATRVDESHEAKAESHATAATNPGLPVYGLADEWLSLHVLAPTRWQNRVIGHELGDLLESLREITSEWFFLRYSSNSKPELRIRFHLGTPDDFGRAAKSVSDWCSRLHRGGLLGEAALRTFTPEYDRYGGSIVCDEMLSMFHTDSRLAKSLLKTSLLSDEDSLNAAIALMVESGIDYAVAKTAGQESSVENFSRLMRAMVSKRHLGGDRPRVSRFRGIFGIDSPLLLAAPSGPLEADISELLDARREAIKEWARNLPEIGIDREVHALNSSMHMTANRLLGPTYDQERRMMTVIRAIAEMEAGRIAHKKDGLE